MANITSNQRCRHYYSPPSIDGCVHCYYAAEREEHQRGIEKLASEFATEREQLHAALRDIRSFVGTGSFVGQEVALKVARVLGEAYSSVETCGYEADAARFRWLTEDIADRREREQRNILLARMAVMSYSAASADIDATMLEYKRAMPAQQTEECKHDVINTSEVRDSSYGRCWCAKCGKTMPWRYGPDGVYGHSPSPEKAPAECPTCHGAKVIGIPGATCWACNGTGSL